MTQLVLLTFYRSMTRHKFHAALTIGCLAVGLAVFILVSLYVRFESTFETWLPHHSELYVVETRFVADGSNQAYPNSLGILADHLRQDFPKIGSTRVWSLPTTVRSGSAPTSEQLALVDPNFFDLFGLPVLKGNARAALADPSSLIMTQSMAHRYFGAADPVGRTITLSYRQSEHVLRVAAIIADLPENTDLRFDMLARLVPPSPARAGEYDFFRNWNSATLATYLRLSDPATAHRLARQLDAFVDRNASFPDVPSKPSDVLRLSLRSLDALHFDRPGVRATTISLGLVGALTLLVAIVNYVNLATARAGLRAREVATRKILGADTGELLRHFMGEAIMTCAIAGLFGLALAENGLPFVDGIGGLSLRMEYFGSNGVLLPLTITVIAAGALSGVYPALVLARLPAAAVLASASAPGGGRAATRLREALVVLQFGLAITCIIATSVVAAQLRHIQTADPGYSRDDLLVIPSIASENLGPTERDELIHALARLPGVGGVAIGNGAPGDTGWDAATNVSIPKRPDSTLGIRQVTVGADYLQVVGARLLAGRLFDAALPGDDSSDKNGDTPVPVVIDRTAAIGLGYASPQKAIGQIIGGKAPMDILGVIDDLHFLSPRAAVQPTRYEFRTRRFNHPVGVIRITGDPRRVLQTVNEAWTSIAPEIPFDGETAALKLDRFSLSDERAARLFALGAGIAVSLACFGLWGLASFNTARRVKEIGIRKVLGASSRDIVGLLVGQFLRPVLVANLLAWPLAYFATRAWLRGFPDRVPLSPMHFVGASAVAVVIAVLTVLGQSLRASRATPAWALRHE